MAPRLEMDSLLPISRVVMEPRREISGLFLVGEARLHYPLVLGIILPVMVKSLLKSSRIEALTTVTCSLLKSNNNTKDAKSGSLPRRLF